jgi:hypothetical protein
VLHDTKQTFVYYASNVHGEDKNTAGLVQPLNIPIYSFERSLITIFNTLVIILVKSIFGFKLCRVLH